MKIAQFTSQHVDAYPWPMTPGIMYVCEARDQAMFLCACGCGSLASIWLNKGGWTYTETDAVPDITGSILTQPCGAHYWVRKGEVCWA